MNIYQEKLLESIDTMIEERMKELKFNYTIDAKIIEDLTSSEYKILYNGDEYKAKAINNQTYKVDDLVYVLVLNNDFSNKKILCKIP